MKTNNQYSFTTKDLDLHDMNISFIYRGFSIWNFNQVAIRRAKILNSVMYANKVVRDYLGGV